MAIAQDKMKELLKKLKIPYKEIEVYGSRIVITCHSRSSAEKWGKTLSPKVAKLKGIIESYDLAKKQKGTILKPTRVKVWRAFFVI